MKHTIRTAILLGMALADSKHRDAVAKLDPAFESHTLKPLIELLQGSLDFGSENKIRETAFAMNWLGVKYTQGKVIDAVTQAVLCRNYDERLHALERSLELAMANNCDDDAKHFEEEIYALQTNSPRVSGQSREGAADAVVAGNSAKPDTSVNQ